MHGRRIIEVVAENPLIRIKVLLQTRLDGKPVLVDELIDVVPVAQRHGLGTHFLGRQVEHAARLGIAEIRAYVSERIRPAMSGIESGRSSDSTGLCRGRSSTSSLRNWPRPEGSAI
jgi:GNAT superfamily N-acetyltransferase